MMLVVSEAESMTIDWPDVSSHFEKRVMSKPVVRLARRLDGKLPIPPMLLRWRIAFETGAENWIVTVDMLGQSTIGLLGVGKAVLTLPQRGDRHVHVTPSAALTETG